MAKLRSEVKSSRPTLREEPEVRIGDRQSTAPAPASFLRKEHPILSWQRIYGNRGVQRRFSGSPALQPKLSVGAPDDVYEKEADEVAQQFASQSALARFSDAGAGRVENEDVRKTLQLRRAAAISVLQRVPRGTLQQTLGNRRVAQLVREALPALAEELRRKCACGGEAEEECADCRMKRLSVQPVATDRGPDAGWEAPAIVEAVLSTPGQPLADTARCMLEPAFGHEFGQVRVHDDSKAAESAASVGAVAYTVGNHIVFGSGQYAPGTADGNRLLAHELTHTIQQAGGAPVSSRLARLFQVGSTPIQPDPDLMSGTPGELPDEERRERRLNSPGRLSDANTRAFSLGDKADRVASQVMRMPDFDGDADTDQPVTTQSCAGWESDPQSLSKRVAENFAQDAFNTTLPAPDTIQCSGKTCVVHYSQGQVLPFDITVDLSQVPGIVSASGTAVPVLLRPQTCSYRYSCDVSGSISFTRINCNFL